MFNKMKKFNNKSRYFTDELNKLGLEFARYKERWDKLSRSIQSVNRDVENFSITTDKLSKKFELINKVDIEKLTEVNKLENDYTNV